MNLNLNTSFKFRKQKKLIIILLINLKNDILMFIIINIDLEPKF